MKQYHLSHGASLPLKITFLHHYDNQKLRLFPFVNVNKYTFFDVISILITAQTVFLLKLIYVSHISVSQDNFYRQEVVSKTINSLLT